MNLIVYFCLSRLGILDKLVSVFFYLFIISLVVSYFEPARVLLSYGGPVVHYLPLVGKAVFKDEM